MAYLKELARKCSRCPKRSVVELRNRGNEALAQYCRQHGAQALARQQQIEAQNDAAIAQNPNLKGLLA
jgi:hypothetical protein